jgi:hypothetical protein
LLCQDFRVAQYHSQKIVEIVCNAAGQLPERVNALGLLQLFR